MSPTTPVIPSLEAVAFIGGGQMALALAEGFSAAGLVATESITVYDPAPAARERLATRLPGINLASTAAGAELPAAPALSSLKACTWNTTRAKGLAKPAAGQK